MTLTNRIVIGLIAVLLLVYVVVLFRTAWLCDDAYITFRTIDNFVNGLGLRWNPDERVQSFTHPLWLFVLAAPYWATGDMYVTSLAISIALSIAAVLVLATRIARTNTLALLGVAALISSKAFVDYSTSGLENPLTFLCLGAFLAAYFSVEKWTPREILILVFIAAAGMLNRLDTALFYAPALLLVFYRRLSLKTAALFVLGLMPLVLWEAFSLIYYGFLFPNTAYAKLDTGIRFIETAVHGIIYFYQSVIADPPTLFLITLGILFPLLNRERQSFPIVIGLVLYLFYILRIGGDFMGGRFLAAPVFWATALICRSTMLEKSKYAVPALLGLVYIGFLSPSPPVLAGANYGDRGGKGGRFGGVTDERAYYYRNTGLLHKSRAQRLQPTHKWVADGKRYKAGTPKTVVHFAVGFRGFYSGPDVFIVDRYALTDPLLARLPALYSTNWRIGHFTRKIPPGYVASVTNDDNRIRDPELAKFYDDLRLVTRGPLFTRQRWNAIWAINSGRASYAVDPHPYRFPGITMTSLEELAARSAPLAIRNSGAEVDIEKLQHIRRLELKFQTPALFEITYVKDGKEVGVKRTWLGGDQGAAGTYRVRTPWLAAFRGFDTLRIFPTEPKTTLKLLSLGLKG